MFSCFLLHVLVPAVGYALFCFCTCLFIRRRSALFYLDLLTSRRYWLMLLWTPRLTCLSGPVSGLPLPASPLASADSHYLCNVRPWLRQGLGCSRADPRGILSLRMFTISRAWLQPCAWLRHLRHCLNLRDLSWHRHGRRSHDLLGHRVDRRALARLVDVPNLWDCVVLGHLVDLYDHRCLQLNGTGGTSTVFATV